MVRLSPMTCDLDAEDYGEALLKSGPQMPMGQPKDRRSCLPFSYEHVGSPRLILQVRARWEIRFGNHAAHTLFPVRALVYLFHQTHPVMLYRGAFQVA